MSGLAPLLHEHGAEVEVGLAQEDQLVPVREHLSAVL